MPNIDNLTSHRMTVIVPFGIDDNGDEVTVRCTVDPTRWTTSYQRGLEYKTDEQVLTDLVLDWDLTWGERDVERFADLNLDPPIVEGETVPLKVEHLAVLPYHAVVLKVVNTVAREVRTLGKAVSKD